MFFFYLDSCLYFGFGAVCILLGIWAFRAVRTRRPLIRLPVCFVSVLVVIFGLVAGLFFGLGSLSNLKSAPIYSPDHKHAIQVEDLDYGATGGDTLVVLYSAQGLLTDVIFSGEWKVVDAKDVRWFGNTAVRITYRASPYSATCQGARGIAVKCEQVPDPAD
jgi:hypothetical protein